jgi:hypothetical protein
MPAREEAAAAPRLRAADGDTPARRDVISAAKTAPARGTFMNPVSAPAAPA